MSTRHTSRLLVPAILLGMQACWFYTWASLIEASVLESRILAVAVVAFAPAGAAVYGYLRTLPLRLVPRIACYWLVWYALAALAGKMLLYQATPWTQPDWILALPHALLRVIFESQPAELLLLLGSACAWYLGGRVARSAPDHGTLLGEFQFGLLMLLGSFLVARGLATPSGHHIPLALVFFALSLAGVAITRSRQDNTGVSLLGHRHFASSLIGLLLTVSLLGLLASIAVTPSLINAIVDAAHYVVHLVGAVLSFLISLIPQGEFTPSEEVPPPAGDDSVIRDFYRTLPWPPVVRRVLQIIWTVMVLAMVLVSLWRICSMVFDWLKRRSDMRGVEMESLNTGLLADLLALLVWLGDRIRLLATAAIRFVQHRTRDTGEMTWSSMYAALLHWAGKRLLTRDSYLSVHEYQVRLSELLPAAAPDLAYVTNIYARARYGRHEPDPETLEAMSGAIGRIRKAPRPRKARTINPPIEGES